jgi:hypothetical protein
MKRVIHDLGYKIKISSPVTAFLPVPQPLAGAP